MKKIPADVLAYFGEPGPPRVEVGPNRPARRGLSHNLVGVVSLRVRVDDADPTPPYEQLRRQLTDLIMFGTLTPDARLPSVRQFAADLALAAGTVARTCAELEKSGLVTSRRGAGTRVASTARTLSEDTRQARLAEMADDVVQRARLLGVSSEALHAAIDQALAE